LYGHIKDASGAISMSDSNEQEKIQHLEVKLDELIRITATTKFLLQDFLSKPQRGV
jgi:hypothetical protein